MAVRRSIRSPLYDFRSVQEEEQKESVSNAVDALGVIVDSEALVESEKSFNNYLLTGDRSIGHSFTGMHNSLVGLNSRIFCNVPIDIKEPVSYSGITFETVEDLEKAPITIFGEEEPHVIFQDCTFIRHNRHGKLPLISIENGARVVFLGCRFLSVAGAIKSTDGAEGMVELQGTNVLSPTYVAAGVDTIFYDTGAITYLNVGDTVVLNAPHSTNTAVNGAHTVKAVAATYFTTEEDSSSSAIAITNVTGGGAGGAFRITTDGAHGQEVGDRVYITSITTVPDITGYQLIVAKTSTTFDLSDIFTSVSGLPGTAYLIDGTGLTVSNFDTATAARVQFVGCSRIPEGADYTTTASDASATKTGCI